MFDLMPIPQVIQGRSAWYGPHVAASGEWIEQLSQAEIAEIDAAAQPLRFSVAWLCATHYLLICQGLALELLQNALHPCRAGGAMQSVLA